MTHTDRSVYRSMRSDLARHRAYEDTMLELRRGAISLPTAVHRLRRAYRAADGGASRRLNPAGVSR